MNRPKSALAALQLAIAAALPVAAQQSPSTPQALPNETCAGCFAYLEFSSFPWAALGALFLGAQHAQAQPAVCSGDRVCIADDPSPAITRPDRSPALAKIANLADRERCPGALVAITAASREERHLACSAAGDAIRLLGRCGITLRRPLDVLIVSEVRQQPSGGVIFGLFDPKQERVFVAQEASIPSLTEDTPYAKLPQREFYKSLIVHEVVHGIMHQNLKRPATSHAAHEYPAYALQIESLTPQSRDTFLQSFDQTAISGKSLFNDPVLFFDPFFFAARAYRHFKASPDGCAYLSSLLDGEVAFIAPPQM